MLDPALSSRLVAIALGHVAREYPAKLDHVINGPGDVRMPRALHPLFFGSFDWHSNVHTCWLLATLYRGLPALPERSEIRRVFDERFTETNVAAELDYLAQPSRATFERPYGWAWLLMLAVELDRHSTEEGRTWARRLRPLAEEFARRFRDFLPKATYPIRAGTHGNTAFAVALALEYARQRGDADLATALCEAARRWYAADAGCQAWEPCGDDFLSPALVEAECMRRMLPAGEWLTWFDRFLPGLGEREPPTLFRPAIVRDRTDGRIVHLDGVNLSRAWCWRHIAASLPSGDTRRAVAIDAADLHLSASLPHVADDYAGAHCLPTFALLAIIAPDVRPDS